MKRTISAFLLLSMVFALLCTSAFAATKPDARYDDKQSTAAYTAPNFLYPSEKIFYQDGKVETVVAAGNVVYMTKRAGVDGFDYLRKFTFNKYSGELLSCYYENENELYRFTFENDEITYVEYTDKVNFRYLKTVDTAAYADWKDYILFDAVNYDATEETKGGTKHVNLRTGVELYVTEYVQTDETKVNRVSKINVASGADTFPDAASIKYSRQYLFNADGTIKSALFQSSSAADKIFVEFENGAATKYTNIIGTSVTKYEVSDANVTQEIKNYYDPIGAFALAESGKYVAECAVIEFD